MPATPPAPSGVLFVIATPIGHPGDITLRAIETLRRVDVIAAEDTRAVAPLLAAHQIAAPTVSYHDFNEQPRSRQLVDRLLRGEDIALLSEAGTPLVSDPGYRLVTAAIEAGVTVTSIPGPCAAVAALVASGLPANRFLFVGFPPRTAAKRRAWFLTFQHEPATIVIYEAPHRLVASLADLCGCLGDRRACLVRNLTKPSESWLRGTLHELLTSVKREEALYGEMTLVVAGADPTRMHRDHEEASELAERLAAEGIDSKGIVTELQANLGLPRREAYRISLAAKRTGPARHDQPPVKPSEES